MIHLVLLAVAAAFIALAVFVLRANPSSPINRLFAAQTMIFGTWTLAIAGLYHGHYLEISGRLAFASASILPVAFLAFVTFYPVRSARNSLFVVFGTLAIGLLFSALSLFTNLIAYDRAVTEAGYVRRTGSAYPVFASYIIFTWGIALTVLVARWRKARGIARAQLQHLVAGVLIAGLGGIGANLIFPLLTGRSTFSWLGPCFGLAFVLLVAHAVIRHRLMDLRVVVHKGLTVSLAAVLSSLPVVLVVSLFWPTILSRLEPSEVLLLSIATIGITLLVAPTRDLAALLLDRYVYRSRANYQRTVSEASQFLTQVLDLRSLLCFVSQTVRNSVRCGVVSIYLGDEDGFRLAAAEHGGSDIPATHGAPEAVSKILVADKPIISDEIARMRGSEASELSKALRLQDWALVLPIAVKHHIIGFIAVGSKMSGDPFYPEDLDLLTTLTNQAGIAIKNAQLYAEILLANQHIENIVATIESGVVAINDSGRITIFNRASTALVGRPVDSVLQKPVTALPGCLQQPLQETLADGVARSIPEVALSDGKVTRPVICTTSPLRDPSGNVLGAVAVFSDLTPFKELEVERHRAEKLAYFEMLASALAHEIKNPLVAVKTFAQLVPRRLEDGRFVDRFSHIVTREIGRMERLIDRLRALSRPGDRPRAPLDVRVPLTKAVEFLHPAFDEKRIRVTLALAEQPLMIEADETAIEELVLNLLMNAYEVLKPESEVTVRVSGTSELATVVVEDTGPGIPPELMERVFDPFFTTKQRGSGLGLAISASIARSHGARLRATNRPGGGAAFSVEFPLLATVPLPARA